MPAGGIAEAGGGSGEGVGEVHDGTNELRFAVAGAGIDEGVSRIYDGTNLVSTD